MSHKRVLIIGGAKKTIEKAKKAELEVIYIQKKSLFDNNILECVDQVFLFDYENLKLLRLFAKAIYEAFPFCSVISMSERGLIPAAYINDLLGLQGNSLKTVKLLKNKLEMRECLNKLDLSVVHAKLGTTENDIISFGKKCGFPVIVKPVDGTASMSVFLIKSEAKINSIYKDIKKAGLSSFLIEEYLDGPEVSVETFTFNGNHIIISITNKLTNNFVEIGHSVPAQLNHNVETQIKEIVTKFLDVVGLQQGPSHTELKLTSGGPKIIESHNRVGGDQISELVNIAYGIDMVSLTFKWACGLIKPLNKHIKPKAGAVIRFFTPPPGSVKSISGVNEVKKIKEVVELELNIKEGNIINRISNSKDRPGYLLVKSTDVISAISNCEELMSKIDIKIE